MDEYSLAAIEVEGFRGFNAKQKFAIDNHLTLISGNNGVGKSSLLGSVEWCLYGDVSFIKYMDSKVRDELVNQSHNGGVATVNLTLKKGSNSYRVGRSKELGTRSTDLTVRSPPDQFDGDMAEQEVYKLFGLTLDDFVRAVYLHQESIRGLLTDNPQSRDEALDRLFGLDRLRNLVQGIPIKAIKDEVQNLNGKKETLGGKIKGALGQIQADLNKLRAKAADVGIPESDLTLEKALDLANSVRKRLIEIAREYGLTSHPVIVPTEASQIGGFARKVNSVLKEYATAIIGGTDSSDLSAPKRELDDLLEKRRKALDERSEVEQTIASLTSSYESPTKVNVRLATLDEHVKTLEGQRQQLDAHSRLVEDAIEELGTAVVHTCPVCKQTIDHGSVLSRLKTESERHFGEEVRQLDEKKAQLEQESRELHQALDELNGALASLKEFDGALSGIDMQLVRILAVELTGDELVLAATAKIRDLQKTIAEAERAYTRRAEAVQDVRQLLEQVTAISDVLEKMSAFDEVNKHFADESSQIQSIDSAVGELQKLEMTLDQIIKAVSGVQVALASGMINKAEADISSYYSRLVNHPYYDRLKVDVKPRDVRGLVRNSYSIRAFNSRDGNETSVSSRFSTGQMNCVALAIYLALTKVLPVSLGFMMLDDPSQNLDPAHKKALAGVLKDVLSCRQVIVATQDSELISLMKSEIGSGTGYVFSDWGVSGPKITVEQIA